MNAYADSGSERSAEPVAPPRSGPEWPQERATPFDPRRKSPILACVLSAMPGLGQVYVGYYQRGFLHIAVVGGVIALLAGNQLPRQLDPLLGLFLPFFWLYNIIDAGRRAAFYNTAVSGGDAPEMPGDMALPHGGGSLAGGLALVVVGLALLLNTRFDVSLAWVEDWWPLAPALFGVYLVGRWIVERRSAGGAT